VQTGDQAQQRDTAAAQAVRLPGDDPSSLLLVAPAEQQVQLGVLPTLGMVALLRTMSTLTLMDLRILHQSLSRPLGSRAAYITLP
jgi:hypothetical protein